MTNVSGGPKGPPFPLMGVWGMTSRFSTWAVKAAERILWTAVQAGLGLVTVEMFDLPSGLIVPIAAVLAWVKAAVAKKVGNPSDPATLPWGV